MMHYQLSDDIPDRKLKFCKNIMTRFNRLPDYLKTICFCDESTFNLSKNVGYFSDTKPRAFHEKIHSFQKK